MSNENWETEPFVSGIPEHDKRELGHEDDPKFIHPDVIAAYDYVDSVEDTNDADCEHKAWHGWALREAFLAGISYAKRN